MTRTEDYAAVVAFHGHECPGAALGARMAEAAITRIGRHEPGNALMALAETDICGVDAIQVLTGCTAGKRNLRQDNTGKVAFTFWRQGATEGFRILAKFGSDAFRDVETWTLSDQVSDGTASENDRAYFAARQAERIQRILAAPEEEIFDVVPVALTAPEPARVYRSEPCQGCHEPTSIATLHDHRGSMLCPSCHRNAHGGQVPEGHGAGQHQHPAMQGGAGHHHQH